jgi:hypothetical protein
MVLTASFALSSVTGFFVTVISVTRTRHQLMREALSPI